MTASTRLVPNHAHWGAFLAEVQDGRFVGVKPFGSATSVATIESGMSRASGASAVRRRSTASFCFAAGTQETGTWPSPASAFV